MVYILGWRHNGINVCNDGISPRFLFSKFLFSFSYLFLNVSFGLLKFKFKFSSNIYLIKSTTRVAKEGDGNIRLARASRSLQFCVDGALLLSMATHGKDCGRRQLGIVQSRQSWTKREHESLFLTRAINGASRDISGIIEICFRKYII